MVHAFDAPRGRRRSGDGRGWSSPGEAPRDVRLVVVPLGGGGLISGIAIALADAAARTPASSVSRP